MSTEVAENSAAQDVQEVSYEELSSIKKKIKLKVSASHYKQHFDRELNNVGQRASFKGFRPGKVPRAMVEKLHGGSVRVQVIDNLVNSSIKQIAKTRELDVLSVTDLDLAPALLTQGPDAASDIEFSAVLVLYPKPEVKDYKGLSVTVTKPNAGEKEVDEVIERMRESRASLKAVEKRKLPKAKDVINAEVQIKIDGEEESRPEPLTAEVSDASLPQEVRDELLKIKVDETREIPVTFAEDYSDANLRGKKGIYKITLKGISEKVLPELDDEFAKSAGLGAENASQLREKVTESLQKEIEQRAKNDSEVEIIKAIIEKNAFEVPEMLIDDEIRNLAVRSGVVDPKQYDVSKIPVEALRPGLGEVATQRVKATIVVDRIAELENLKATKEEMEAKISQMSAEFGIGEEEIRKFVFQDGRGVNMLMDITRGKVMDFLINDAKIEYKEPETTKA